MTHKLTVLSPEGHDIATYFLEYGSAQAVAEQMQVPLFKVMESLAKPETKKYLDQVYLDSGYRNREKLGALLDRMIDRKIEDAEETGIYTSKDLLELIQMAHRMRMEEIKAQQEPKTGTTVQIANSFGNTGYGKLMTKLIGEVND